jgi:hypothetical protein
MVGRIGQLTEVAIDDLAGLDFIRDQDRLSVLDRRFWATYFVVPDRVLSVTIGSTRTFFTHWDSPRVDTRYFTPPTATGVMGIVCGCLLRVW